MANVGDLFINVRAKTGALNKGLRRARRSLTKFARSGTAIIAGIAGAFGIFKTFQFLMGSLLGNSQEFREAWAAVGKAVADIGAQFAKTYGPALAEGLNTFAEWLKTTDAIEDTFEGMAIALEALLPIMKALQTGFVTLQDEIVDFMNWFTGTTQALEDLANNKITDPSQLESADTFRRSIGLDASNGGIMGSRDGGIAPSSDKWLKTIAERVEVPK